MSEPKGEVTALLRAWSAGDAEAREKVMALMYLELRQRAAARLRRERPGYTLEPTGLVHEAYIRLVAQRDAAWENRAQFLAIASEMMRRILVDRARARLAAKRSGQWAQITLGDAGAVPLLPASIDLLDLNTALEKLAAIDRRKSQIAEMKFFGGLSFEEMGQVLQLSARTVERDWQAARALLFKMLSAPGKASPG